MTEFLLERKVIKNEEKELYAYGLFMLISYIVFFLISILFGILLSIPFFSMLFFLIFCLIRNYAGGIHAHSEIKCDIITTLSILISELLIKIFIENNLRWIALLMLIMSSVAFIVIKPVATEQKKISEKEQVYFHKKVIVLDISAVMVSIISIALGTYKIMISLSIGLSLAGILLILGKIQQKKIKAHLSVEKEEK